MRDNRLLGIEQIDITGSGKNPLRVNLREVLNISDESNTLVVWRNSGDVVNIGTGRTQDANQTIGVSVFNVFTQGVAILKLLATNNAPTDIVMSGGIVVENAPTGSIAARLTTTDPDSGNTHAYTLSTSTRHHSK